MNKTTMAVTVIALIAALGSGYWLGSRSATENPSRSQPEETKAKPLYYRHPMNPAITSAVPAKDEMGMDYVAVFAEGQTQAVPGTVLIDPVTVQNIGVRTAKVERRVLTRNIRALGRIDFDEGLVTRLHPKTEGWIEELRVNKTGQTVAEDDILLSIYSPRLVTSQEEYLLALKNLDIAEKSGSQRAVSNARNVISSSRERLELLDVPEHQIRELEDSRKVKRVLHIHSPFKGVVMHVGSREGQYVTPKTELYMIADLAKVWALVDVYEFELPWIRIDDEADMRVVAVPGRIFSGRITYIYPYMEAKTRTVKVRLEFDNLEGLLKPEMFANITIKAQRRIDATVVPSEAIVRSGTQEQIFVVRGPGKFEPRLVTLGVSSDGFTQIISGVTEGEEVVTSAQFLIDSESKLREATAKMMELLNAREKREGGMQMDHDQMDQGQMDHGQMDRDQKNHDRSSMD